MASFNPFNILNDEIDSNNILRSNEESKKEVVIDEISSDNELTEEIEKFDESKEYIDSYVDEIIGLLINLPVKIESHLWRNGSTFDHNFKSLVEFSPFFIDFMIKHGSYSLDIIFAAMEYNPDYELTPIFSTLLEFFLFKISQTGIHFKKQDYVILDAICKVYPAKLRFSSIIGGRDVTNDSSISFRDSGLELTAELTKSYKLFVPVLIYLQRNNKLNFDYPQFHGDIERGIRAVESHTIQFFINKKWMDNYGVCYYNTYKRSREQQSDSKNYNKFLAVLSYIKGLMYPRNIRE
jgi:hypothetical protein